MYTYLFCTIGKGLSVNQVNDTSRKDYFWSLVKTLFRSHLFIVPVMV